MSFFIAKLILGSLLFFTGIGATFTMLALMGKTEKRANPASLKKLHKFFGYIFFFLLLVLAVLGFKYWASLGENISMRALLHAVLALVLLIVLITKVLIIRLYKQFLKMVPTMGLIVFSISFVIFSISGIYYVLRSFNQPQPERNSVADAYIQFQNSVEQGKKIFDRLCFSCHSVDSEDKKMGPSLMGLSGKNVLPHTGKPVTFENIKQQLIDPVSVMPAFKNLTELEIAYLTAFLKNL